MMVWLLEGPDNRTVLVDAGFYRDEFTRKYQPEGFPVIQKDVVRID